MGISEWIAAVVAVGGFAAWLLAFWLRLGRVLERLDFLSGGHKRTTTKLENHEHRGSGPNVLLGGSGDDKLNGGSKRDLLIGGTGADSLTGNGDDDILIAGTTAYDAWEAALCGLIGEWTSTRDYATRLANLNGTGTGQRANGNFFLKASSPGRTVFDDLSKDTLTGASGLDAFFANFTGVGVLDKVNDRKGNEDWYDL